MPIIAKDNRKEFTPAPEGLHLAVCCDVVDLGMKDMTFGGETTKKHRVRVCWQIDDKMPSGEPFIVVKEYTASLHEKANLRKDLEAWRGKRFTEPELDGFDLEKLIGVPCQLLVVHNPKKDGHGVWANIGSIMCAPRGTTMAVSENYVRAKDRAVLNSASPQSEEPDYAAEEHHEIADEDIPF